MMTMTELQNEFEVLEKLAKKEGAEVEMSVGQAESFSAGYQQRKLKKYASDNAVSASFRVLYGKGTGVSTTEKMDAEALKLTFNEALQSAKDLSKSKTAKDLEPALHFGAQPAELPGLFHSDYSEIPVKDKLAWAEELEKSALDFDARVTNVPYSGYSNSASQRFLLNSKGTRLSSRSSSLSAYSYALAKANEDSKSGYTAFFSRTPAQLNTQKIAHSAAQKSLAMLGATQPTTGHWTVVLSNEVASSLVGLALNHFSAKALDENTSLLKDKKGTQVFSKLLTWMDDPLLAHLPASRSFDAEGAAAQRTSLVENGVMQNYLTNLFYARKMNLPHTASAVRGAAEMDISSSNVIMQKGTATKADLLKSDKNVILITEVEAIHSGYKEGTGDFSLPSSGFLYQNGQMVGPLHQFVFSGNLMTLLKDVAGISNEWNDDGSSVLAPDFLIPNVSIAGKS